ncbi:MAG: hypothetical protein AB9M60_15470 [Leptothrix sp. (in: b-proteobacteria)]
MTTPAPIDLSRADAARGDEADELADIARLGQGHEGPSAVPLSGFAQRLLAVWWPAFLMAGMTEMLVFAFVDPRDLHWLGGAPLEAPRSAVYTLAFFAFWVLIGAAGSVSQLLLREPADMNRLAARRRWP